jgi:hypothetical protein
MDPPGELPQLPKPLVELVASVVELAQRLRVALEPRAERPQAEGERDQALLRPVVQVALDASAGRIAGLDDARAGCAQLLDPRP